ncbi:putative transcriptional regulator [Pantoea phage vB_PagS_AAS23]|uniref:Putative transcriptional regulator n=1 Tax=Pantoea phage vB_PagS_AAS23 TaxID=2499073 RepID=A0A3S9U7T2_9CAUD|nr:putative transcriptional regulator [Pantoea phage vB_PagS_AAS23]AZS06375.1 putative transcriptional regulator [Pantoea phage vB_PagS_AAS23]
MSKVSLLTNAQVITIMRMGSGTLYEMSGNLRYGREVRIAVGRSFERDDVACKSLAPLMRRGLIKFKSQSVCNNSSFYAVVLSPSGREMLNKFKENSHE